MQAQSNQRESLHKLGLLERSRGGCPAFGAIVLVPLAELAKSHPLPPQLHGQALCPAWCSEVVSGKSLRQVHKMAFFIAKKNCLRSRDARKIAAFDKWTDLRDRNFGNVIQSSKGGYVAIDHETFPSGTSFFFGTGLVSLVLYWQLMAPLNNGSLGGRFAGATCPGLWRTAYVRLRSRDRWPVGRLQ